MQRRALSVREQYEAHERERYGQPWSLEHIALGLVGDVGDLVKLIQARGGMRDLPDVESALEHELADVLWSLIVIADRCEIDLEGSFTRTMDELDGLLSAES